MPIFVYCPYCAKPLVYGVWRHILECAKATQEKLERGGKRA